MLSLRRRPGLPLYRSFEAAERHGILPSPGYPQFFNVQSWFLRTSSTSHKGRSALEKGPDLQARGQATTSEQSRRGGRSPPGFFTAEMYADAREAAWGPKARATSFTMHPESVFLRLCSAPKNDIRIGRSDGRWVPALFHCPECKLDVVGEYYGIVHKCAVSGRVFKPKDMERRHLLYPCDMYLSESIRMDRRALPAGVRVVQALDHLPNFKWPSFVQELLHQPHFARLQLGEIFFNSTDSSPDSWLAVQAVDRLMSLPQFQILADNFTHAFHLCARNCTVAAKHVGSRSSSAMWYSGCGATFSPRCGYLTLCSPTLHNVHSHYVLSSVYVPLPRQLSAKLSTASAIALPPSSPQGISNRKKTHSQNRLCDINSIWDLPVAVRRRLVYATFAEADKLHGHLKGVDLRGVVEWQGS